MFHTYTRAFIHTCIYRVYPFDICHSCGSHGPCMDDLPLKKWLFSTANIHFPHAPRLPSLQATWWRPWWRVEFELPHAQSAKKVVEHRYVATSCPRIGSRESISGEPCSWTILSKPAYSFPIVSDIRTISSIFLFGKSHWNTSGGRGLWSHRGCAAQWGGSVPWPIWGFGYHKKRDTRDESEKTISGYFW